MGTKVAVTSVVYNLAGDIHKRPNVLKSTVVAAILANKKGDEFGSNLVKSYLNGTGIKLKRFSNWAERFGYSDYIGVLSNKFIPNVTTNSETLIAAIPHAANETLFIDHWVTARNDVIGSAVNYIRANFPTEINGVWEVEYLEPSNSIRISWGNGSQTDYVPTDFVPDTDYLFVYYSLLRVNGTETSSVIFDTVLTSSSEFEDVTGFTLKESLSEPNKEAELTTTTTVTREYSDGRPLEVTTTTNTTTTQYDFIDEIYEKKYFLGGTETALTNKTEIVHLKQYGIVDSATSETTGDPVSIGAGVTYVETTKVITESLTLSVSHKKEEILSNVYEREGGLLWIYEKNTGHPELDLLFGNKIDRGTLFPYIPIRINNHTINPDDDPLLYRWVKKAYYKATSSRDLAGFIDKIDSNESIGDMDYIYLVFGVSLNTVENVGKKYIFKFFKNLYDSGATDAAHQDWTDLYADGQTSIINYDAWWHSHTANDFDPLLVDDFTILRNSLIIPPRYYLFMGSPEGSPMNYHVNIEWEGISFHFGSGLAKPNAKLNEVWVGIPPVAAPISGFSLVWQVTLDRWECITVAGLHYRNSIYKTKTVEFGFTEALADDEESGFIIPLQKTVLDQLGLVDVTQLTTSSMYAVINCYKVYKTKWYQTGIFKVLLVIVAVVIAVYTGYFDISGAGLLGSNLAVGSAIGLSGTAAALAGLAINAIAAIVLANVIKAVSVSLFGEKLGAIIAAIANIAISAYTLTGGNLLASFNPGNLLKLTVAAANEYANVLESDYLSIQKESEQLMKDYEHQMSEIRSKYQDEFGISDQVMVDYAAISKYRYETPEEFLSRTSLSGSDIVDLSLGSIGQYVTMVLENRR